MLSNKNLALALEENARRRGRHPAIIEGERTITYRELDDHVRRIAGHLGDQGIGEGSIVGVCLHDCADHLMILYAVARLGGVILPLDWRWTEPEKLNVAQFFEVALVIAEPAAGLASVHAAHAHPHPSAAGIPR